MVIYLEWCVTEAVLATKGTKIPKHLQWPRHDRQIQFLGNMWEVYYAFPALKASAKQSLMMKVRFLPKSMSMQSATYETQTSYLSTLI